MATRKSDEERAAAIRLVINAAATMINWSGFDPEKTWVAEAEAAVSHMEQRVISSAALAAQQIRVRLAAKAERDAAVARAGAAEAEAERLRGLLSAERDGYAAGVADGRKAGAGEERDLIVACLRDFEKNGLPGLLSGAAQHIEAGCHWPDPLTSVW